MGPDAMIFVFWMLSFKSTQEILCSSFIKVRKGTEKASDIDIRRGMESAPLTSLSKGVIYFFNWLLQ